MVKRCSTHHDFFNTFEVTLHSVHLYGRGRSVMGDSQNPHTCTFYQRMSVYYLGAMLFIKWCYFRASSWKEFIFIREVSFWHSVTCFCLAFLYGVNHTLRVDYSCCQFKMSHFIDILDNMIMLLRAIATHENGLQNCCAVEQNRMNVIMDTYSIRHFQNWDLGYNREVSLYVPNKTTYTYSSIRIRSCWMYNFRFATRLLRTPYTVPDLPLPGPWARLKFRAASVKIEVRDPHGVGSWGPFEGPGGGPGGEAPGSCRILWHFECKMALPKNLFNSMISFFSLSWFRAPWISGPGPGPNWPWGKSGTDRIAWQKL